jgi:hypothetical protein
MDYSKRRVCGAIPFVNSILSSADPDILIWKFFLNWAAGRLYERGKTSFLILKLHKFKMP